MQRHEKNSDIVFFLAFPTYQPTLTSLYCVTQQVSGGKQFGQKYTSCDKCECGELAQQNPTFQLDN